MRCRLAVPVAGGLVALAFAAPSSAKIVIDGEKNCLGKLVSTLAKDDGEERGVAAAAESMGISVAQLLNEARQRCRRGPE